MTGCLSTTFLIWQVLRRGLSHGRRRRRRAQEEGAASEAEGGMVAAQIYLGSAPQDVRRAGLLRLVAVQAGGLRGGLGRSSREELAREEAGPRRQPACPRPRRGLPRGASAERLSSPEKDEAGKGVLDAVAGEASPERRRSVGPGPGAGAGGRAGSPPKIPPSRPPSRAAISSPSDGHEAAAHF